MSDCNIPIKSEWDIIWSLISTLLLYEWCTLISYTFFFYLTWFLNVQIKICNIFWSNFWYAKMLKLVLFFKVYTGTFSMQYDILIFLEYNYKLKKKYFKAFFS